MFHPFSSDTVARRQAPLWRFPWKFVLTALAIVLVAAIATSAIFTVVANFTSSTPAKSAQTGMNVPVVVPAVEVPNPQVPQSVQENVGTGATAPVVWPMAQVEWTLVEDLSILPPAEEGFYNGTIKNRPYGAASTLEWAAYAGTIVPEFGNTATLVAAARDPTNKQIVLVGLDLMYLARINIERHQILEDARGAAHLFLSVDGEKTWTEINRIPVSRPDVPQGGVMIMSATRVMKQDETIRLFLYSGDGLIEGWWTATVP